MTSSWREAWNDLLYVLLPGALHRQDRSMSKFCLPDICQLSSERKFPLNCYKAWERSEEKMIKFSLITFLARTVRLDLLNVSLLVNFNHPRSFFSTISDSICLLRLWPELVIIRENIQFQLAGADPSIASQSTTHRPTHLQPRLDGSRIM